ncbi:exosortase family protein XrtF [Flavobacterium pallidum]|uniref:Exosortase family protein XrtF n=1 Tax=Flavobacterium pallidum TaxID=2172098 RepID=A0A2S1SDZ5_9FLAO|nr:exosortase family protein XrtF [Flavobacterium pallidum]AWI24620.1 exosortase family protein XrtF [Flavobacterium pallidum]
MKSYLQQYKPFLIFLGKFLFSYFLLLFLYQLYLNSFDASRFEPDGATKLVSENTVWFLRVTGHDAEIYPHPRESSYKLFLDGHSIARIVEGCNAVSVMILFAAFIIAFSSKWLRTSLFIISGILLIHVLNVIRVGLISVAMEKYPQYKGLLHDVIFPLFIYGVVFGLWVLWINKYSFYAKKTPRT